MKEREGVYKEPIRNAVKIIFDAVSYATTQAMLRRRGQKKK
jgi:hypothetical protein